MTSRCTLQLVRDARSPLLGSRPRRRIIQSLIAGAFISGCLAAFAGSFTSNFTNPTQAGITLNGGQNANGDNYPIIQNGTLLMTYNEGSETAGAILDDLDNGQAIDSFVATFGLQFGPGSGTPADGFSFNFS